jgi:catechol 2,3-dioxygenase-like lactoylglutathione lyase family enzyme
MATQGSGPDDGDAPRLPLVHLNLQVHDTEVAIAFYRRWFGFTGPPRTYPDGIVAVSNADGFDLAFHPGDPPGDATDIFHFGFRAPDPEEVRRFHDALHDAGVPITETVDEAEHVSVKCLDPDGYEAEVYWET